MNFSSIIQTFNLVSTLSNTHFNGCQKIIKSVKKNQNLKNILFICIRFQQFFRVVDYHTTFIFYLKFLTSFPILCHPYKPWICFYSMHLRFKTRLMQLSPPFILPPKTFLNYLRSIPLDLDPKWNSSFSMAPSPKAS